MQIEYTPEQRALQLELRDYFAKMLTPGRDPAGFFITAAIGIAGSLLATYGGQALGLYRAGEAAGFLGSLIGAIILLVVYHLIRGKTAV